MSSIVSYSGLEVNNSSLQKISIASSTNVSPQNGDIWYDNGMQFRNNGITSSLGEANTASSAGGTQSLVLAKSGVNLPFKGLTAGTNITLTPSGTDITIATAGGGGEANTTSSAGGTVSLPLTKVGVDLPFRGLTAGSNVILTQSATDVTLSTVFLNPTATYVKVGTNAGLSNTGANVVCIGSNAGVTGSGANNISIGNYSGSSTQDFNTFIGYQAGQSGNPQGSTYVGYQAGQTGTTNSFCVGVGYQAGQINQGANAVAIGSFSGNLNQGTNAVAVGYSTANSGQGANAVALGSYAGLTNQGAGAVAMGYHAADTTQGTNAVAIGFDAGQTDQGASAVAIGSFAGQTSQHANTIIINATGSALNSAGTDRFYIAPVRDVAGNFILKYNTTTSEVTYDTAKTFVIDHPFDNAKYLVHACIESPESGVMYRGEGEITKADGCLISLPDYCRAWYNFTISLTPTCSPNPYLYSTEVINNEFMVFGDIGKFKWVVYATRISINTEPLKTKYEKKGDGPYTYLVPVVNL